jgi:hypothetical protein
MKMMTLNKPLLPGQTLLATFFMAVLAVSAVSAAALPERALSLGGEVIRLESTDQPNARLKLFVGDAATVVPGTDNAAAESPLGLFTSRTGVIQVVWLSRGDDVSTLHVASYSGDGWAGPYGLVAGGEPVRFAASPFVSLDEDQLKVEFDEQSIQSERQILHVVWLDENQGIRYSPLVFRNGKYIGWNEIVTLSSAYRQAHSNAETGSLGDGWHQLLALSTDASGGLLVTLADDVFGRIGTLRLEATPLILEILGDSIHDHVLDSADLYDPDDLASVADEMRAHIVHVGSRLEFNPNVSSFLSERVDEWIRDNGSSFGWDLTALAGATRNTSLDLAQAVYAVTIPSASGDSDLTMLNIGDFLDDNGHRDALARLLQLQVTADFSAPAQIGSPFAVHVAQDGSAIALSWIDTDAGAVRWIENHGALWSDRKSVSMSDAMSAESIRELITSSIR